MEEIKAFKGLDGNLYEDKEAAKQADDVFRQAKAIEGVMRFLDKKLKDWDPRAVCEAIVNNIDELSEIIYKTKAL